LTAYEAVFFDLGGVVLDSPLHAIAAYEGSIGIPVGTVNRVVVDTAPGGAWSRLERGEISMEVFFGAFEADCLAAGESLCARDMMERIATSSGPRPAMLRAIQTIRDRGLRVGAITNNWVPEAGREGAVTELAPLFDAFVESSVEGVRKPDPRIYEIACQRLGVAAARAIFLDDIGGNLKAARKLGMATIKVVTPEAALEELSTLLGFDVAD